MSEETGHSKRILPGVDRWLFFAGAAGAAASVVLWGFEHALIGAAFASFAHFIADRFQARRHTGSWFGQPSDMESDERV